MQRKTGAKQPLLSVRSKSPGASQLVTQRSNSLPRHSSPDPHSSFIDGGAANPGAAVPSMGQPAANPSAPPRRTSQSVIQARIMQKPAIAPGQPAASSRNKEKLIKLPESVSFLTPAAVEQEEVQPPVTIFQDIELPESLSAPGNITAVCMADAIDRRKLEKKLRERGGRWLVASYPDVVYGQYWQPGMPEAAGDVFYFDYGVVVLWGLPKQAEQSVLTHVLSDCVVMPLARKDIETDVLEFRYVVADMPNIQNDTVTVNYRLAGEHKTKLAIAFALSQSTKLSVYEEKVLEVVEATKDIPEELASKGVVTSVNRKQITKLIGEVFLQKSEVNLLSTVLDTPEFFWGESDRYEALYRSAIEYLEFEERVELLNNRFQVLQEMLEIARSQENVAHTAYLDWVVIILILLDLAVLMLQFVASLAIHHH